MNTTTSRKCRHGSTTAGVIVGILGTLLVLAVVIGIMMMAMGRCPYCGHMLN